MAQTDALNLRVSSALKADIQALADEAEVSLTKAAILLLQRGIAESRADGQLVEYHQIESDQGKRLAALKQAQEQQHRLPRVRRSA